MLSHHMGIYLVSHFEQDRLQVEVPALNMESFDMKCKLCNICQYSPIAVILSVELANQ